MTKVWYYMKQDKKKYGPHSDEELIKLIKNGIIEAEDYIWMTDLDHWIKVENSIYAIYLDNQKTIVVGVQNEEQS